ncbi:MAG TPA: ribonuclease III [Bacillota bacterium]|nr:ribonuclease III [Bacillota bacterium]
MRIKGPRLEELKKLQDRLGYRYKDIALLNCALTHSSYANEKGLGKDEYNERLEFLGDAVLEMITSEFLYNEFADCTEGTLTKMRAALVRGKALGQRARELGLGDFLQMGKGEDQNGGRSRISILADAFEAVIGSIYLDGGYAPAREFVLGYLQASARELAEQSLTGDYKTELQETVQASGHHAVEYRLVDQEGPDHDKTFRVRVLIGDRVYGEGTGKSKKEAEQNAAQKALERLEG